MLDYLPTTCILAAFYLKAHIQLVSNTCEISHKYGIIQRTEEQTKSITLIQQYYTLNG